jgi:hypothetical protein
MIVVRDIFQIQPDHMKKAKELAQQMRAMERRAGYAVARIMTDLTGEYYTLVFESEFKSLGEYETALSKGMSDPEWQKLYPEFRKLMRSGRREIYTMVE